MRLDFELCDLEQNVLTRLDNRREGGRVELGLNSNRRATVPLSLGDPARKLATSMDTVLRVTLRDDDSNFSLGLITGRVTIPEQSGSADSEGLVLNASDQLFDLDDALIGATVGGGNPLVLGSTSTLVARWISGTEQSQIMWMLIDESDVETVMLGDLEGSVNRDRTYPAGKSVGEALVEMTGVIFGPDFELVPVVRSDGILSRFDTHYPRQGTDLSGSIEFVYGKAPFTAQAFGYSPGGSLTNRVVAVGAPIQGAVEGDTLLVQPGYIAEHLDSIGRYGVFERYLPLEDVSNTSTLQAHAIATVAAGAIPVPYFSFSSGFEPVGIEVGEGVPPAFGRDYWIGDTIGVVARTPDWAEGDEDLELTGRITDATIIEHDSGQLSVQVSCSPEVSSSDVTGETIAVVQPGLTE